MISNASRYASWIQKEFGVQATEFLPIQQGATATVYKVLTASGTPLVLKCGSHVATEARGLQSLRGHGVPAPDVLAYREDALLLEYIHAQPSASFRAEANAAEIIEHMHSTADRDFGYPETTYVGGLAQPNETRPTWIEFWREQRLLHHCQAAFDAGRLDARDQDRTQVLAAQLADWLDEPRRPCLLHGDLWSGNILCSKNQLVALIDPGLYYGHPEADLAFLTLFHSMGRQFFDRYNELQPLHPDFARIRCPIYNLVPLLIHVRLFGGTYLEQFRRQLTLIESF